MQQATDFFEEPVHNSLSFSANGLFASQRPPEPPSLTGPQLEIDNNLGYDIDTSDFTAALRSSNNKDSTSKGPDERPDTNYHKNDDSLCPLERELSATILYTLSNPDRNIPQLDSNLSLSFNDLIDEPEELRSILENAHPSNASNLSTCNDVGIDEKMASYSQGSFYIMGDQMLFQEAFDYDDHHHHTNDQMRDNAHDHFDTSFVGDGTNGSLTSWMIEGMDQEPMCSGKTSPIELCLSNKQQYYNGDATQTFFEDHDMFHELSLPIGDDRIDLDHDELQKNGNGMGKLSQLVQHDYDLKPRPMSNGTRALDFETAAQVLNYELPTTDFGVFYDQMNDQAPYTKLLPEPRTSTNGKRYIKSSILKWAYNELEPLVTLNDMQLEIEGLDPLKVSNSVKRTIEKELRLQDQYLAAVMQGRRTLHLMKPRRRRNPTCDDLTWIPVSLYQAAYTNIKIHPLEKTDYSNEIPNELCFGKVNMRVKRAWLRGPNKQKLLMMRSLMLQGMMPDKDDLQLEDQDDGECLDYFLFQM